MATLAAEFPNDNPVLHRGAVWVCLEPVGIPVPERPATEPYLPAADATEAAPVDAVDTMGEGSDEVETPSPRISGVVVVGCRDEEDELYEDDGLSSMIVVEELEPIESVSVEGVLAEDGHEAESAVEEPANDFARSSSTALPPPPDDPFVVFLSTLADVAIGAGAPNVAALLPGLLLEGTLVGALPEEAARALEDAKICRAGEVTPAFLATTRAWQAILRGTSDDFSACGAAMLDEWAAGLLARLLGRPEQTPRLRSDLRTRGIAAFGLVEAA